MNCIIIDDEATARAIISQLCSNVEGINVFEEFPNAIQAIKYLNQNEVDLIFLDIHMPDFTGFDFIETIKNPPRIILTTSDSNFAIQAFEYDCIVDYLVKPITQERFIKSIEKAKSKGTAVSSNSSSEKVEASSGNDLYVNIDRRLVKIHIPNISLVEAKGDYIYIKTDNEKYIVHSTLKRIEKKLPDNIFVRVHRSYIINLNSVRDIQFGSVLVDNEIISVSRSRKPELIRRLNML